VSQPAEAQHRALLQAIVEAARAIFGAAAASVFLYDEERSELVFEAVAGEGSDELVGRRFPAGSGIAGSVLATRQPLVVEQVEQDPRFAREAAEATGYVPSGIMAVPLVSGDRPLGVLSVLDRRDRSRSALEEIELLGLFAEQAAIALDLLAGARGAGQAESGPTARLVAAVDDLEGGRRRAADRLLEALVELIGPEP
jgi:GAF domain-containing protein